MCRWGRGPPVLLSLPPPGGSPSEYYQKLEDSSPKARLARCRGAGRAWTLLNAVGKAAFTLRAPRPAWDSVGSTTARRSAAFSARARLSTADSDPNHPFPPLSDNRDNLRSCRSRRPRSKAAAPGNHTDTITTLTSQKPLRPGPGPKTRKQTPSSYVSV